MLPGRDRAGARPAAAVQRVRERAVATRAADGDAVRARGLATREEALARRERAVKEAESRKREETAAAGFARRFKGWGDDGSLIEPGTETGDATVEDVVARP